MEWINKYIVRKEDYPGRITAGKVYQMFLVRDRQYVKKKVLDDNGNPLEPSGIGTDKVWRRATEEEIKTYCSWQNLYIVRVSGIATNVTIGKCYKTDGNGCFFNDKGTKVIVFNSILWRKATDAEEYAHDNQAGSKGMALQKFEAKWDYNNAVHTREHPVRRKTKVEEVEKPEYLVRTLFGTSNNLTDGKVYLVDSNECTVDDKGKKFNTDICPDRWRPATEEEIYEFEHPGWKKIKMDNGSTIYYPPEGNTVVSQEGVISFDVENEPALTADQVCKAQAKMDEPLKPPSPTILGKDQYHFHTGNSNPLDLGSMERRFVGYPRHSGKSMWNASMRKFAESLPKPLFNEDKEEKKMLKIKQNVTLIEETDADSISKDDLIDMIREEKGYIKDFDDVTSVKSKAIAKIIVQHEENIEVLVAILDAKKD